ncbi:AI-2E family transporter [Haloimpatiens massiliensis]|uniref:AI-2E family transporter n=1 Tax=Haloimpatiens massiliensis TaxID=1658110 RepID=UPI0015E0D2CF|nr:AI-2E family transporter [Haloimpatiens massiliensis]
MEKYNKLIKCILLLAIFILVTILIKKYFKPFFTIIIIFYFSNPLYKFFCKHKIFSNKINALISILFINIAFFLVILLVGNFIFNNVDVFKLQYILYEKNLKIPSMANIINIQEFLNSIKNVVSSMYSNPFIKKGAFYTFEGILAYFIGNIIVYFVLIDRSILEKYIKELISEKNYKILKNKLYTINKILQIELGLVIITTIETILGFVVLKIEHPVVLGLICGILDIIPYIGTIVIFIPLILYKIYCKQYIIGIGLILLYVLLAVNRGILEAKFMSHKFKIHPVAAIISFYIGIKFFGVVGMFMGPLYVLTVKETILA